MYLILAELTRISVLFFFCDGLQKTPTVVGMEYIRGFSK